MPGRQPDVQVSDHPHLSPTSRFNWAALLFITFLAITVAGILASQGLIVAFGVMGITASVISMVWNRIALEELFYDIYIPKKRAEIGETIPVTVSITNRKPVPLTWVTIEDEFPDAIRILNGNIARNSNTKIQRLRNLTSMGRYERIKWQYTIRCVKRGLHRMGPATIESGDPFGFMRTRKVEHHRGTILVLPRTVPLPELGLPAVKPLGEVRGGNRIYEDFTRPTGLRDYRKGDPLIRIDWKATARARKLLVRSFDPSSSMKVIIGVSVETGEPFWRIDAPENLERVITVAASVANYVAEIDCPFGLFSNDMTVKTKRSMKVPPSQQREQLGEVMAALATIPPMASGPMSDHLAEHGPRFKSDTTLVLCTALVTENMVSTLTSLDHTGMKIIVMYVGDGDLPLLPPRIKVHNAFKYLTEVEASERYRRNQ